MFTAGDKKNSWPGPADCPDEFDHQGPAVTEETGHPDDLCAGRYALDHFVNRQTLHINVVAALIREDAIQRQAARIDRLIVQSVLLEIST